MQSITIESNLVAYNNLKVCTTCDRTIDARDCRIYKRSMDKIKMLIIEMKRAFCLKDTEGY